MCTAGRGEKIKTLQEHDRIALSKPTSGEVIGQSRKLVLPMGTIATVVLVHGDPIQPKAYEVEAYVPEQDCYVLATVEGVDI